MSIQPPPPPPPPPPGSYPSMAPAPWETPAVQGPPPSTVVNAFKLILVQAALGLVSERLLLQEQRHVIRRRSYRTEQQLLVVGRRPIGR